MQHDFLKDPIALELGPSQGWLKATGTTLGADNGIGAAAGVLINEKVTMCTSLGSNTKVLEAIKAFV